MIWAYGSVKGSIAPKALPEAQIIPDLSMRTRFCRWRVVTLFGMDSELPPTLRNLARQQQGVVSRSQALRAGLSADMIKFRLRGGWWRPLHRGVYLTFTGAPRPQCASCGRRSSRPGRARS